MELGQRQAAKSRVYWVSANGLVPAVLLPGSDSGWHLPRRIDHHCLHCCDAHSISDTGQTENNSVRAYVFRFAPNSDNARRIRHVAKVPVAVAISLAPITHSSG
jgi:hypothetical protein